MSTLAFTPACEEVVGEGPDGTYCAQLRHVHVPTPNGCSDRWSLDLGAWDEGPLEHVR